MKASTLKYTAELKCCFHYATLFLETSLCNSYIYGNVFSPSRPLSPPSLHLQWESRHSALRLPKGSLEFPGLRVFEPQLLGKGRAARVWVLLSWCFVLNLTGFVSRSFLSSICPYSYFLKLSLYFKAHLLPNASGSFPCCICCVG